MIVKTFESFNSLSEGYFYHNSDREIEEFSPQPRGRKKNEYLYFSEDENAFIDAKYTYKVRLRFDPDRIFCTFQHQAGKYGISFSAGDYREEIMDLFASDTEYFIDEWEKTGVDSPREVIEYYLDEGGNEDDKVGLLYYFLTKWNDSWSIIETDRFLEFIESKGFTGFVTNEEGILCIATKDYVGNIEIVDKKNMW